MDSDEGRQKIVRRIIAATGRQKKDVDSQIEAKKEKFSGLLTDSGAAFMVAKELGVEISESATDATQISALRDGMNNVDVIARLKRAYPPREFEKNGRKGKLQNIVLADATGEIRATLWNKDVEEFNSKALERGTCLRLSNCSVNSYKDTLQLSINYNGTFEITAAELPELKEKLLAISDLKPNMRDVCVKAVVKKIFPGKEFENERGKGKVVNFFISKGTEEIRASAWNEMCDDVEGIIEGTEVKIEGAYTKEGMNGGTELHLGRGAKIIPDKDAV
ncbi:MAG: DUF2240 family protein [archaeon]|nr:DUF2240 family protein [archaeon]